MSDKYLPLNEALYKYMLSISSRESDVLRRLREETAKLPDPQMQISPDQGQFMALLVKLIGAKRALEVGVFTGYSSLCVALALPPDGSLIACDINEEWTSIARRYWREADVDHKIKLQLRPALESLDILIREGQANSFEFAFVDADKGNYLHYYERVLQLLRPGGLVIIDNTLWSGRVADPGNSETDTIAIRAFNAKLHRDPRISLSLLPVADGLTLALKRA